MNENKQVMLDWSIEEWSHLLEALAGKLWTIQRGLKFVSNDENKTLEVEKFFEKTKNSFIKLDNLCPYDENELVASSNISYYRKVFFQEYLNKEAVFISPPKEEKKRFKIEL